MSKKPAAPPIMKHRINLPLGDDLAVALDEWRRRQPDIPGRPEAIRRVLVEALLRKPAGGKR